MPRIGRIWMLVATLAVVTVAGAAVAQVAKAAAANKWSYSQHKYHRLTDNRTQEWHNCDFKFGAKIAGDFTSLQTADAQIQVTVEKVGSGTEITILAGQIGDLGSFAKTGSVGKLKLAPGLYNYKGSATASAKGLSVNFSAKTSKESADYSGGNYILPIDEAISNDGVTARPPFTGTAILRVYVKASAGATWTTYSTTLTYKGRNAYVFNRVLPSQTLAGKV